MQQNSKCGLSGDGSETVIHIISECSKLAQKEHKTRHHRVEEVTAPELYKQLKFDHATKLYMQ